MTPVKNTLRESELYELGRRDKAAGLSPSTALLRCGYHYFKGYEATVRSVADEIRVTENGLMFLGCLLAWDTNFDTIYFLEKPWKWEPLYVIWEETGSPQGQADETFEAVCELWDAL
jgi:hypothetical protein